MFILEILALIYLCKLNGGLALKKGLKPRTWKIYTVIAWLIAEFIGFLISLNMFDKTNLIGISIVSIFCAFGGYLFVRNTLENKPDNEMDNDINRIGVDDLQPPKK